MGKSIKQLIAIAVCLFIPLTATSETISVYIGSYKMLWDEGAPVQERARAIAEVIQSAAEEAGLSAELKGECIGSIPDCLAEAVRQGYDRAVLAEVEATDASYDIAVRLNDGEEHRLVLNGAFADVKGRLKEEVVKILRNKPMAQEPLNKEQPASSPAAAKVEGEAGKQPPASKPDHGHKKLGPWVFWTAAGLSLCLAGTWVALDSITHHRYKELEKGDKSLAYWQASTRLRNASQALFIVSTIVVPSVIAIAPLTNFRKKKTGQAISFSAIPTWNGGAAVLNGRF